MPDARADRRYASATELHKRRHNDPCATHEGHAPAGPLAEHQCLGNRVAGQPVGAVCPAGRLASGSLAVTGAPS